MPREAIITQGGERIELDRNRAGHASEYYAPECDARSAIEAALSHIRALLTGLRRLSTMQGKASRPQTLEAMIADAKNLRGICTSSDWVVPATASHAIFWLVNSFRDDLSRLTASSHRTCAKALDFLSAALASGLQSKLKNHLPLRVMVIEDDAVSKRALIMSLNLEGIVVVPCSCGEEALEKLRESHFHIIFSDIMMPRISGFNLLPLIRDLPNHRTTPVVFVTALNDFQTKARSVTSGTCDFVAKPFLPPEIVLKAITFGLAHLLTGNDVDGIASPGKDCPGVGCKDAAPSRSNCNRKPVRPPLPAHKPTKVLGIITVACDGSIATCNKDARDMFGYYKPGALIGEPIRKLFPHNVQSEEGRMMIDALHSENGRQRLGQCRLIGRTADGKSQDVSVTFSQSEDQRLSSTLLLVSATKESSSTGTSEPMNEPLLNNEQAQSDAAPGNTSAAAPPSATPSHRAEEMLKEELARSRAISATLEQQQEHLEAELTSARETNNRLQQRLREAEAHTKCLTESNFAHEQMLKESLASFRLELISLIREIKTELRTLGECRHADRLASAETQSRIPAAPAMQTPSLVEPTNGASHKTSVSVSPDSDVVRLKMQLDRQQLENKNHALIQTLLCDCVRKLDPLH